jgi:hypothetical protein
MCAATLLTTKRCRKHTWRVKTSNIIIPKLRAVKEDAEQENTVKEDRIGNLFATVTVRLFQSQPVVVETARLFSPGCCD